MRRLNSSDRTNEPADPLRAMIPLLGWEEGLAEYCVGRSPALQGVPRGIKCGVPGTPHQMPRIPIHVMDIWIGFWQIHSIVLYPLP